MTKLARCIYELVRLPIATGTLCDMNPKVNPIKAVAAKAYLAGYRDSDLRSKDLKCVPDPIMTVLLYAMIGYETGREDPNKVAEEWDYFVKGFLKCLDDIGPRQRTRRTTNGKVHRDRDSNRPSNYLVRGRSRRQR